MKGFNINPYKFIIPGTLFLILGFGNIYVGTEKANQYGEVLSAFRNLEKRQSENFQEIKTPLKILKETKFLKTTNVKEDQTKAYSRKSFYDLVILGGKFLLIIGFALLIIGLGIKVGLSYKKRNSLY